MYICYNQITCPFIVFWDTNHLSLSLSLFSLFFGGDSVTWCAKDEMSGMFISGEELESGSGENVTIFRCSMPDLSSTNITNESFWDIIESIKYGHIGITVVESILFLVGFFWNMFIILTYIYKRTLLKQPANIYLFALAIVDTLICAFLIPLAIVTSSSQSFLIGQSDMLRCHVCFLQGFLWVFFIMMSLNLLAILSVDRCLVLSHPLTYDKKMVWWLAVLLVCLCLVGAFITAIPPAFDFGEWEFNFRLGTCIPRWTGSNNGVNNLLYIGFIIICVMISIVTIVVSNVFTFRIVYKFLRQGLRRRSTFRSNSREQYLDEQRTQRQQRQLVKVFIGLMVANIVTWSPIIVVFIVFTVIIGIDKDHVDTIPTIVFAIGWVFFLSNPVIHPILESFFIKELRYQVRRAKKRVRRSFRMASRSLVRVATGLSSDILEIPEDSPNLHVQSKLNHTTNVQPVSLRTEVPDNLSHSSGRPNLPHSGSPMVNGKLPFSFGDDDSRKSPMAPDEVRVHSPLEHSTVATSSPSPSPSPVPDLRHTPSPGPDAGEIPDSDSNISNDSYKVVDSHMELVEKVKNSPGTVCDIRPPRLPSSSPTAESKPFQSCNQKESPQLPRPGSPSTPTSGKKTRHVSISLEDGTVFHSRSQSESSTARLCVQRLSETVQDDFSDSSGDDDAIV